MTLDTGLLDKLYRRGSSKLTPFDLDIVPTPVIPVITETDIRNKFFTRYFARYANNTENIVEIDKQQYAILKDNPRFKITQLRWKIVGNPYTKILSNGAIDKGVEDVNKQNVREVDATFGGLTAIIRDYLYLWVADELGNTKLERQTEIFNPAKRPT
jgi:hypothetical protein